VTVTALRLEDGDRVLDLSSLDYRVSRLDLGFPSIRAVSQSRPDSDGETDTTSRHGASVVSLDMILVPSAESSLTVLLDALRSFCHPATRPYLVLERDGQQRRIQLRADQQTAPITDPFHQQVQAAWRAPDGVMEALAEQIGTSDAVAASEGGRSYPRSYPLDYADSPAVGSVTVSNDGTVEVWPVLRMYGPASDPRVENQSTGERLVFSGLTLAAGDWLEVDCRERTIRLNGLPSQSRYYLLDFTASTFLRLVPGVNTVRYYPVSFGDGARLEVRYRSAWL
jgi:hypothetical protein